MRNLFISTLLIGFSVTSLYADENRTSEGNQTIENNTTENNVSQSIKSKTETNSTRTINTLDRHLEEQIKREEKYAKEQRFYQGDEYDLSTAEVDEKSLKGIKTPELDFSFVMDDVYD